MIATMSESDQIPPPLHEDDQEGAQRVFDQFLQLYQPTLVRVEYYLEEVIEKAGDYSEAYKPWYQALHNLYKGVYLTAKKIPLNNKQRFIEALQTFSFDSALQFLEDLCANCRIALSQDWIAKFKQHVQLLLFAFSIMNRNRIPELAR
ncbi:MAG: hypothetical protein LW823_02245 [Rickettsiales bacterium]|jgi:hypothetical protein|nr:hypothetical protein [Rickettsiales bacterium]